MRLLNADGSASEVSGNGVRCVAAWLAGLGDHAPGASFAIDTDAGTKMLRLVGRDDSRLTFVAEMGPPADLREVDLDVGGNRLCARSCCVSAIRSAWCWGPRPPSGSGRSRRRWPCIRSFPRARTWNWPRSAAPAEVRILIWERGVGPTESSGTGACAAAVAAAAFGGASRAVDVVSPGGRQHVEWTDAGIRLTGWAEVIGEMNWWLA